LLAVHNLLGSLIITLHSLLFGFTLSKSLFRHEDSVFFHIITGSTLSIAILVFPSLIIGILNQGLKLYFLAFICVSVVWVLRYVIRNRPWIGIDSRNILILVAFSVVFFLRPLLLLAIRGVTTWDSLDHYFPTAKAYFNSDAIPLIDPQRPGYILSKPPLMMILYSFYFLFSPPPSDIMISACLLFALGLGSLSAEIIHRKTKSLYLALLAMGITVSVPVFDYVYSIWGTMLDLPFSLFFLASIYYLFRILTGKREKKYVFMFYCALSLAFLTKELIFPFVLTYFIVFAFFCKERALLVSAANLLLLVTRIGMGLLSIVSFDWVPLDYVILGFALLFCLQWLVLPTRNSSGKPEQPHFRELLRTFLDESLFVMIFPLIWYSRNIMVTGSPVDASLLPYFAFGIPLGAVLLLSILHPPRILAFRIKNTENVFRVLTVILLSANIYYFLSSPIILGSYYVHFAPLGSLIYFFLSNWFGSMYIIPKAVGIFKAVRNNDAVERTLVCIVFFTLSVWYSFGSISVRYIAHLMPVASILIVNGLIQKSISQKKSRLSLLSFIVLSYIISLFASFNYYYESSLFGWIGGAVRDHDILLDRSLVLKSILISIVFTAIFELVVRSRKFTSKVRIKVNPKFSRLAKCLFLTLLVLPAILLQIPIIVSLQDRHDRVEGDFNMSYKQLLDDLSIRFEQDNKTILTIGKFGGAVGTAYWSDFQVIDLSANSQTPSLNLRELFKSENRSKLFDFFRTYNIILIILPNRRNWYYDTYQQYFLNQDEITSKYFPDISLLLQCLDYEYFDRIYGSGNFTFLNPYDYFDVYHLPDSEELSVGR